MISKSLDIITTLGPSARTTEVVKALKEAGATCFRINLSHASLEELDKYLDLCEAAGVPASLDTQGGQIRITSIPNKSQYRVGDELIISCDDSKKDSDKYDFHLNHRELIDEIKIGDTLKIGFEGLTSKVTEVTPGDCSFRSNVLSSGQISINKAIDISSKPIKLEALTRLDKSAFHASKSRKIHSVFISFCNSGDDVKLARHELRLAFNSLVDDINLVAKVETKNGVENLPDICSEADAILVDRGDLSREISIAEIPSVVDEIIAYCRFRSKPVYIATNVLDCMMNSSLPSRSEISDIHHLMNSGVNGLVLAAEVAIGKNPIDSTKVLNYLHKYYLQRQSQWNCRIFAGHDNSKLGLKLPVHIEEWL